jgi:hypothetical protein
VAERIIGRLQGNKTGMFFVFIMDEKRQDLKRRNASSGAERRK